MPTLNIEEQEYNNYYIRIRKQEDRNGIFYTGFCKNKTNNEQSFVSGAQSEDEGGSKAVIVKLKEYIDNRNKEIKYG